jgi:hypothetical protein
VKRPKLPVASAGASPGTGAPPVACPGKEWISEEEIAIALEIRAARLEVRAARADGDPEREARLRSKLADLRDGLERARRRRLDRLGLFDYD